MVSQEPVLFARSVKENIKYGQEDATDKEIFRAAELANAHKFINELPNGYSTGLSEQHCSCGCFFGWFLSACYAVNNVDIDTV